jgi:hypothetical protein
LATLSTRTQTLESSGGQVSNFGTQASPSFFWLKKRIALPSLKIEGRLLFFIKKIIIKNGFFPSFFLQFLLQKFCGENPYNGKKMSQKF